MYKMTYAEIIEGDCRQARANEQAYDPEAQRKLRELSLRLTGLGG